MDRRNFLKNLGILVGTALVAPSILAEPIKKNREPLLHLCVGKKGVGKTYRNFFPDELVQFAKWFSKNYTTLSTTNIVKTPEGSLFIGSTLFYSEKGNYLIRYYDIIKDDQGKLLTTPTRINRKTRVMEFSKDYFVKNNTITENSVFYMVLWTWHIAQVDPDYSKCDLETLQYYLSQGYPAKDVQMTWIDVFKKADTPQNLKRFKEIEHFLNKTV